MLIITLSQTRGSNNQMIPKNCSPNTHKHKLCYLDNNESITKLEHEQVFVRGYTHMILGNISKSLPYTLNL